MNCVRAISICRSYVRITCSLGKDEQAAAAQDLVTLTIQYSTTVTHTRGGIQAEAYLDRIAVGMRVLVPGKDCACDDAQRRRSMVLGVFTQLNQYS